MVSSISILMMQLFMLVYIFRGELNTIRYGHPDGWPYLLFVGQFPGHRLKYSSHNEGYVHKGEYLQFSAKFASLPCPVL